MKNLIAVIAILEEKRDNGTMTMDEETLFHKLYEKVDSQLFN